jgi:hypothetical protein
MKCAHQGKYNHYNKLTTTRKLISNKLCGLQEELANQSNPERKALYMQHFE